ncbi:SDR family NAD(P)-dependent oxidoreductase [Streptomyces sp. NPDC004044]
MAGRHPPRQDRRGRRGRGRRLHRDQQRGDRGSGTGLLAGGLGGARPAEVNHFGTWAISRAFAPISARNGGGALVNSLSLESWRAQLQFPGYAVSKAAHWSLTDALRQALYAQGTLVVGVHADLVDTALSTWTDAPKLSTALTMTAPANDQLEFLAAEETRRVKAALSQPARHTRQLTRRADRRPAGGPNPGDEAATAHGPAASRPAGSRFPGSARQPCGGARCDSGGRAWRAPRQSKSGPTVRVRLIS